MSTNTFPEAPSAVAYHASRFTFQISRVATGFHGLPRLVPRPESDKTLDFIGLPRVPRPFTPLGVGASSGGQK